MNEKELLRKLGEETIYSAKGHFKACDIRRQLITFTIWCCAVLNIVGIMGIDPVAGKIFAAVCLFGTIALLIWNEGEGKNYRAKHKEAAEKYLALHKEIRACYFLDNCVPCCFSCNVMKMNLIFFVILPPLIKLQNLLLRLLKIL